MRSRTTQLLSLVVLLLGGFAGLSLTWGPTPSPPATTPPTPPSLTIQTAPSAPPAERPLCDPEKLPELQKQMYWAAQRGTDWLSRMHGRKGLFFYGYLPDLSTLMEGDHFLRQIGAAFALARGARLTGNATYAARARQAVLTLSEDTLTDTNDPQVRYGSLPSSVINRLGMAGLLVLAINELPSPGEDLLKVSEQLCNYIRKQQRADGSLNYADTLDPSKDRTDDP